MPFSEFRQVLRRVLGYILPYWKTLILAILCTVLATAGQLSQAKFVGLIFGLMTQDQYSKLQGPAALLTPSQSGPVSPVVQWWNDQTAPLAAWFGQLSPIMRLNIICMAFLLMIACVGVLGYFQRYLINLSGQEAVRSMRNEMFAHLQRLCMSFYDRMRLGEIHSRASNDINIASQVYIYLADFAKNLMVVVLALGWMIFQDPAMTLMVLGLSPVIGVAVSSFGRRIGQISEALQARTADLSAIMYESIASIKVVKAYSREDFEMARFREANDNNFNTQMKLVQVTSTQNPVVEFMGALGIVAIVWFGAMRILKGQVTFAHMTEYWTLLVMTTQPINTLSSFYSEFQKATAAGKRVFEVLDTQPKVQDHPQARELGDIQGRIDFEGVSFSYDGEKQVLEGLDLSVRPGEVLAIVGANGAGKTTLVNLVGRFYDPVSGRVRVDGQDLREVTMRSLRGHIGTVIQESVLFAGSVADNIACGNARASQEEILRASRLANAHEFIEQLPQGYQTEIGERGLRLSGGQRQRIAIARALLRDPRILILDEFTSGIDAESENLITEAIERSMKGRTCLVIAHRLNTIRHADRIIVLEAGRIAEEGNHEDLLARGGIYSRLHEAQKLSPGTGNNGSRRTLQLTEPAP